MGFQRLIEIRNRLIVASVLIWSGLKVLITGDLKWISDILKDSSTKKGYNHDQRYN